MGAVGGCPGSRPGSEGWQELGWDSRRKWETGVTLAGEEAAAEQKSTQQELPWTC